MKAVAKWMAWIIALGWFVSCGSDDSNSGGSHYNEPKSKTEPVQNKEQPAKTKKPGDRSNIPTPTGDSNPNAGTPAGTKSPAKTKPAPKSPAASTIDISDFEATDFKTALTSATPNIHLIAKRTRQVFNGRGGLYNQKYDWRIRMPYIGHQRIMARTYLNDKQIDAVDLYLVPDMSQDALKTYRYHNRGNFGGSTFEVKLTLVHDRVAGTCEINFFRYDVWNSQETLGGKAGYRWVVACPKSDGSLKSELEFSRPGWKLRGSARYAGTFSTTYPTVELWVTEYELIHPRILLTKGGASYADITLALQRDESSQSKRVYRYGPDSSGKRAEFTKHIDSQKCVFRFTDRYFTHGIELAGPCVSNAE